MLPLLPTMFDLQQGDAKWRAAKADIPSGEGWCRQSEATTAVFHGGCQEQEVREHGVRGVQEERVQSARGRGCELGRTSRRGRSAIINRDQL